MEKINVAELLKDCPKGMELYSPLCGDCKLYSVNDYNITIEIPNRDSLIILRRDGTYCANGEIMLFPKGKTSWEGFVPPRKFEDGAVLVHTQNQRFIMSIYHERTSELTIKTHCILWDRGEGLSVGKEICYYVDSVRLATEEEKQKLFKAIKEYGYRWNEETKTLEKLIEPKFKVGDTIVHKVNKESPFIITEITNDCYKGGTQYEVLIEQQNNFELVPYKFDINSLVPFESKVLVRDNDYDEWRSAFWGHLRQKADMKYDTLRGVYRQCIPYEGNEHLLGKTNDCDNFYKTWE